MSNDSWIDCLFQRSTRCRASSNQGSAIQTMWHGPGPGTYMQQSSGRMTARALSPLRRARPPWLGVLTGGQPGGGSRLPSNGPPCPTLFCPCMRMWVRPLIERHDRRDGGFQIRGVGRARRAVRRARHTAAAAADRSQSRASHWTVRSTEATRVSGIQPMGGHQSEPPGPRADGAEPLAEWPAQLL